MSFRRKNKQIKAVRLPDDMDGLDVKPSKGINTLYYWLKHGEYWKADLYGADGELLACGLLGASLEDIIGRLTNGGTGNA